MFTTTATTTTKVPTDEIEALKQQVAMAMLIGIDVLPIEKRVRFSASDCARLKHAKSLGVLTFDELVSEPHAEPRFLAKDWPASDVSYGFMFDRVPSRGVGAR